MRAFGVLLLLVAVAFAQKEKTDSSDQSLSEKEEEYRFFFLPEQIKRVSNKYAGSLKLDMDGVKKTIPLKGEFYYQQQENKWDAYEKVTLTWNGRDVQVRRWLLRHNGKLSMNTQLDRKCIRAEFSEEKDTLPEYSGWRQIGDNQYQQTVTYSNVKLSDIFPGIDELEDSKEHLLQTKSVATIENKKIMNYKCTLVVDGKKVAVKDVHVVGQINKLDLTQFFVVPQMCESHVGVEAEDVSFERLFFGLSKSMLSENKETNQ